MGEPIELHAQVSPRHRNQHQVDAGNDGPDQAPLARSSLVPEHQNVGDRCRVIPGRHVGEPPLHPGGHDLGVGGVGKIFACAAPVAEKLGALKTPWAIFPGPYFDLTLYQAAAAAGRPSRHDPEAPRRSAAEDPVGGEHPEGAGRVVPGHPHPWSGVNFFPGDRAMEPPTCTAAPTSPYWARGDGRMYRVMVFSLAMGTFPATRTFVASSRWRPVRFPLAEFSTDRSDVTALFIGAGAPAGQFRLCLDDMRLE